MKVLLALLCLLPLQPAWANDLLHDVQSRVDNARITRGHFDQEKILVGISRPLLGRGTFLIDRERGVIWRIDAPFKSTMTITQRDIVQSAGSRVLMHLSANQDPAVKAVATVLFAAFSADFARLTPYFEFSGSVDGSSWTLILHPRDAGLGRAIRSLEVRGDRTVRYVDLTAASGDVLHIRFHDVHTAPSPTAAEAAAFD